MVVGMVLVGLLLCVQPTVLLQHVRSCNAEASVTSVRQVADGQQMALVKPTWCAAVAFWPCAIK